MTVVYPSALTRGLRFRARWPLVLTMSFWLIGSSLIGSSLIAEEAQWIWSPRHTKEDVPPTSCYFRKTLVLREPERGEISLTADDEYGCYVNGRHVGNGHSTGMLAEYDISKLLVRGRNIIAIQVENTHGSTAGLAVRLMVKEKGDPWVSFSSDSSWKTSLRPLPFWNTMMYNDVRWDAAREYGRFGETPPWDMREVVAEEEEPSTQRFRIDDEFQVEELLDGTQTGSLIAMTFNEFGHILAARDEGPLLLIYDSDDDEQVDRVKVYCDKVSHCQGILALNGKVYVTADGPEGPALYRLSDENRNGILEHVTTLLKFPSTVSEQGVHGLTLGPDGMIYIVAGNDADPQLPPGTAGPLSNAYEGDALTPRYEDPNGFARGRKAPGGMVVRVDTDGQHAEIVAGGLRNAYDLAFSREGELFVHDSDMPGDVGTPWYRPSRLYHAISAAEFGWRSGWAKWPDYYVDGLPGILDTGRGVPSGAVFYNHFAFPTRYHNVLFLADRSKGHILAVKLKSSGASFTASSERFLSGHPLNVMDLDVGPDGHLYFILGGHGTHGGLYRIGWRGQVPASVSNLGQGISAAIRQPQLHSAWGRQNIAAVKQSVSGEWGAKLSGVCRSPSNPSHYRIRALHLMQLFGPPPSSDLLTRLAMDENEAVRAKAAELMGLRDDDELRMQLVAILEDSNRMVRRKACEALLRSGQMAPVAKLIPLLTSDDRSEAWAARRLLETIPVDQWRDIVLTADDHRLFIQGGLALLIAHGDRENARAVLNRFQNIMHGFISDRDFIDMLRLSQVAFSKSRFTAEDFPELAKAIGEEFPASDGTMNREIVRLIAYLRLDEPLERCLAFLESDAANVEKLHLALHLRFLDSGWPDGQRLRLVQFYEHARKRSAGSSYSDYIANIERDFAKSLSPDEGGRVLAQGADWPSAALGVLYKLPSELNDDGVVALCDLDRKLIHRRDLDAVRLRLGIVAVLGRSLDASAMAYLRESWDNEPERRPAIAMGLAQAPDGENFDRLVRSLPVLEAGAAKEVLGKLLDAERTSDDPEDIRQVILQGLALNEEGGQNAVDLLRYWTGLRFDAEGATFADQQQAWQDWYADEYPERPRAELPSTVSESKWDFEALVHHLTRHEGDTGSESLEKRGARVFETAQCASCHRFGGHGRNVGPDLTAVSQRLSKKQILQSIFYPAHIVSDENAAKTIVTTSGKAYLGIVTQGANGAWIVQQGSGEKVTVPADQVDEVVSRGKSVMREGLLEPLTLEQISDLFAYLGVVPPQDVASRQVSDTTQ
ncbi:MAG: HEAT repeat domain-containing protein [Pirellulaceae bacterium]